MLYFHNSYITGVTLVMLRYKRGLELDYRARVK